MTLNISHTDIINNMNQGFNQEKKSLMTFNTTDTQHKMGLYVINKQTKNIIQYTEEIY